GRHRIALGSGFGRGLVLEGERDSERQADVVANASRCHGSDCTADHVRPERLRRKRSFEIHRDRLSDLERYSPLCKKTARRNVNERRLEAWRRDTEALDRRHAGSGLSRGSGMLLLVWRLRTDGGWLDHVNLDPRGRTAGAREW